MERIDVAGKPVLRVAGRMDAESAPDFDAVCNALLAEGATVLVLDLGDLVYVSSMGLRGIIAVGQTLQEKGGALRICRLHGLVKQVFEITHLNRIFPSYDTVESALIEA